MPHNIQLRQMQKADLKAVHELVQTTIQVSYGEIYSPEAINFFKHHYSKENILQDIERGYIVVAESDSRIVGTGSWSGTASAGYLLILNISAGASGT